MPIYESGELGDILCKREIVIEYLGGVDYLIEDAGTVGELKSLLTAIIEDLPEENDVKIAEIHFRNGYLCITFEDPVPYW